MSKKTEKKEEIEIPVEDEIVETDESLEVSESATMNPSEEVDLGWIKGVHFFD